MDEKLQSISNLDHARCFIWDNRKKCVKKSVKNLGWLLAHWEQVDCFIAKEPKMTGNFEVFFEAKLKNDFSFICFFGSSSVLYSFLHRPVFVGIHFNYFGKEMVIE